MFKHTPGAAGAIHRSAAEAGMSYVLMPRGILPHDAYYPQTFTDAHGAEFAAMSDFQCPATGIYIESKSGLMNGLKNKANADKALSRFEADCAKGFITSRNYNKKKLEASWSASVPKFSAVQHQLAEAGGCVVLIFDKAPDAKTVGRLDRAKVFWCIVGDEHFRKFMSFHTLARYGFATSYTIDGHLFTTEATEGRFGYTASRVQSS